MRGKSEGSLFIGTLLGLGGEGRGYVGVWGCGFWGCCCSML